jgi:hypothetical protein
VDGFGVGVAAAWLVAALACGMDAAGADAPPVDGGVEVVPEHPTTLRVTSATTTIRARLVCTLSSVTYLSTST